MYKKIFLVLLPVCLGIMITAIVLVLPAKASQPPNLIAFDDDEGHHVYGKIDSFPTGLVGEWIVSGTPYTATAETEFHHEHGPFAVGACVGILYTDNEHGGGYRALEISTTYAYKCGVSPNPVSDASGIVITFPVNLVGTWVINTTTYTATNNTRFEQEEGRFIVGGCVEVKYLSATHEAIEIQTADREDCGGKGEEEFFGFIEQVPPTGTITGTWVISGVEFLNTPETELDTEHGPLTVGACAKVEFEVVNGQNRAEEITSVWAFHCLGFHAFNQVYGSVLSFPPDLFGTWNISTTNGTSFMFMTDPSTHFTGSHSEIGIGTCVKVKYYTLGGVNHAVEVSAKHDHHCGELEAPSFSMLIATIGARPTDTLTGTWTFAGVPFTATTATHFEEEDDFDLNVGDCVESVYDPVGGAMLLKRVELEDAYKCRARDGSQLFRLFGFVQSMPAGGVFTGTWEVSGVTVEAITTTLFEQEHGAFAPGAFVTVNFTYDAGTGVRTATDIETHVAPGFGRENDFGHLDRVQYGTTSGEYDRWTVDGVTFLADPAMETGLGLRVGSLVAVNSYQANGITYATRIVPASLTYLPLLTR